MDQSLEGFLPLRSADHPGNSLTNLSEAEASLVAEHNKMMDCRVVKAGMHIRLSHLPTYEVSLQS